MIFELFVMLVGGACAGYFGYSLLRNREFRRVAVPGHGVVVDRVLHHSRDPDGHRSRSYTITVRFRTRENRTVTTEIDLGDVRVPKQGREVRVLYDPQDPEIAQLDTLLGRGACTLVPALAGASAVFIGGLVAFVRTLLGH